MNARFYYLTKIVHVKLEIITLVLDRCILVEINK